MSAAAELLDRATKILDREPGLQAAMAYGSAVTGELAPHSDVDLGVLFEQPLTAERKLDLMDRLQQALGRDVDLVDIREANGLILREILCKGVSLLRKDSTAFAEQLIRMVYNEMDFMPYYRRTLRERAERFAHG